MEKSQFKTEKKIISSYFSIIKWIEQVFNDKTIFSSYHYRPYIFPVCTFSCVYSYAGLPGMWLITYTTVETHYPLLNCVCIHHLVSVNIQQVSMNANWFNFSSSNGRIQ